MHHESAFNYPAEVFAPFDEREVARLRKYARLVDDLCATSFYKAAKDISLTLNMGADGVTEHLAGPGDEAVRSALTYFRQLYLAKERCSFNKTLSLVGAHVDQHPSLHQERAKTELRRLKKLKAGAAQPPRLGINIEGKQMAPDDVIDVFLNGEYFHGDEKHEALLNPGLPRMVLLFDFLTAVHGLAVVFSIARDIVQAVLDEPAVSPRAAVT